MHKEQLQDDRRTNFPSAVLGRPTNRLDAIFAPSSVAVVGASGRPGSVGRTVLENLTSGGYSGQVFAVNPKHDTILGLPSYSSVKAVPARLDLVVVATPARTVPGVIEECAEADVQGAVVLSAGFRETGPEGAVLEEAVLRAAGGRLRIVGPNCLGVMRPSTGLNATFAANLARAGSVGLISQSGAICTAILDWSLQENVGFSAFVSVGSMLDVGWGDLIDYLGDDSATRSIVIYMESIGDARSFLSAAREVALSKPIIVLKAGRTEAASKAAASHTGALTGSDEVLDAAFRRCGALRVDRIADLFYLAEVLAKQPRPRGPRLTILTNAGGPGVLATDALIRSGGNLAALSPGTLEALDRLLPPHWSRGNPIDILGDADADLYAQATGIAAREPESDGLLVVLAPQAMTDPTQTAEQIKTYGRLKERPLIASWMGGAQVKAGEAILNSAGIPTFPFPDTAARVFTDMWRYSDNLRSLYETPVLTAQGETGRKSRQEAVKWIEDLRRQQRTLLTEYESKKLLAAYGVPVLECAVARDEEDAVKAARDFGFPVVLKIHSETLTHKTDVGGVRLDLETEEEVRQAFQAIRTSVEERAGREHFHGVNVQPMVRREGYELIVGSSLDPQFGPVLLFGAGGQLVETFRDRALGLPPLNSTLARRLMEQTRIFAALEGVRGRRPVDLAALEQLLVAFSQLVAEQPWIREVEMNPLLASGEGLVALDARAVLHGPEVREEDLPRPAIRPYPVAYVRPFSMRDGTAVTIRPIRPEDETLMVRFHTTLSERSVYMRYFHLMNVGQRVAHERLIRICFVDYDREMVLVAEREDPDGGGNEIVGVGRLTRLRGRNEAEFAILIGDAYQGLGLGTELLGRLVEIGRNEGLDRIVADILPENTDMQDVSRRVGFRVQAVQGASLVRATLDLGSARK